MKNKLLAALITATLISEAQAENVDYRCIASQTIGFNHTSNNHTPSEYKKDQEFFLTHISSTPIKAIQSFLNIGNPNELSKDESVLRAQFQAKILIHLADKQRSSTSDAVYFIRESSEDPNDPLKYFTDSVCERSVLHKPKNKEPIINCHQESDYQLFEFSLATGKFTYSYLGTWHRSSTNDYFGDSSYFSFGECKEYYR